MAGERPLGPWQGADLARTARANGGIGADANLGPLERFVGGVVKLIVKRLSVDSSRSDPPQLAIFLLHPQPVSGPDDQCPTVEPLLDNGLTQLASRLWFVSEIAARGAYLEVPPGADAAVFEFVTGDLNLGTVPAIVYDPRGTAVEARLFRNGIADEEYELLNLADGPIAEQQIADAVDRVYMTQLATPDAQLPSVKLWVNAPKRWPSENAENLIHAQLVAGFAVGFPRCRIRHEQTGVSGRLDILIVENDPSGNGQVINHGIVELKVLRRFGSTGIGVSEEKTNEWVVEGVEQASAYRNDRSASVAALYCFDMRMAPTGETCFDHVRDLAEKLDIYLRVWFIFSSSKEFRRAQTGASQTDDDS